MNPYIIKSDRIGLRNWQKSDRIPFATMCADPEVMKHFPSTLSEQESNELIDRLSKHYKEFGYTYFAAELVENNEFIGFVGFKTQCWESDFTPCVDIGYRLKQDAWGKGYATEAGMACLKAAFHKFDLKSVLSFTTDTNTGSEHVMKKLGMHFVGTVQHPSIENDPRFKHCVVYRIDR